MKKDLGLAADAGKASGAALPLGSAVGSFILLIDFFFDFDFDLDLDCVLVLLSTHARIYFTCARSA